MLKIINYTEFEKSYLVDVPVKINIWIRPECQRKQFEVIKKARPSILFVCSDGGRSDKEWEYIKQNRLLYETGIDWNCTVYRLYVDENQGLYAMGRKCSELIWNNVDRCIFLEDDHLPTVSFFQFCAELLEKYKDDLRVSTICGYNTLGENDRATADYFFTSKGSIWGIATWRRSFALRSFDYAKDKYVMELLEQETKKDRTVWKQIVGYGSKEIYGGHVAGGEFFYDFFVYSQHQLQIVPTKNMISCIGCTDDAIHADVLEDLSPAVRRMFNSITYEINFPIKHPEYVIPDKRYADERNKVLAYGHPFIKLKRKIYRGLVKLKKGDIRYILRKMKREIEK